jgi:deoxycytidylate deaminase
MKNSQVLSLLENLALKSPINHKYAAVLIHRGKIISTGFNDFTGNIRKIHASKADVNQYLLRT